MRRGGGIAKNKNKNVKQEVAIKNTRSQDKTERNHFKMQDKKRNHEDIIKKHNNEKNILLELMG